MSVALGRKWRGDGIQEQQIIQSVSSQSLKHRLAVRLDSILLREWKPIMCRQLIYTCIAISSKEKRMKHETGLYVHVQERKREQERWGQAEKQETVKILGCLLCSTIPGIFFLGDIPEVKACSWP